MTAIADRPTAEGALPAPLDVVRRATDRARDHLLALQDDEGWWKGELATNVTMDAEDLLLREFLGIRTAGDSEASARWIRSQQREDGTWASFHGGPPELSTTVEAYVALKLCGDAPDEPHMKLAADYVIAGGGVERTRVFTRIWLALSGLWDWERLPVMPPELIFLPPSVPLNIYDWGCWARQTVVPLTVVSHYRPVRPVAFGIDELLTGAPQPPFEPLFSLAGLFQRADWLLHKYERLPFKPGRKAAMRRAAEWIVARQEADGGWGGIQPPWVYSIMALNLMGYQFDHPVIKAGLEGLEGFLVREDTPDGPVRRLEACQSPVWDTALAVVALTDAGVPGDHPAVAKAADWLVAEEITVRGDWSVRRPDLAPGGWAFEFANDGYPDTDDTAEVVIALHRAARRGVARDQDAAPVEPHRRAALDGAIERGVRWLLDNQERDGSWFGRWGANHVYGTGAAVPALVEAGVARDHPAVRRAAAWLIGHQNADGGWGEDLRSYADPAWIGRGESTASQTAWAMLALLAAHEPGDHERAAAVRAATDRGAAFLARTQRADGTWDEDLFTGTGFPGDFYINYHLYRLVFPLTALGRYLADRLVESP